MDESHTTQHRHGVLLSWWFRLRLRIHDARLGYGSLWLLGKQVLLSNVSSLSCAHRVDSYFFGADVPPVAYPEGFQGNEIPLNGTLVAKLVHERLSLAEEADD